MTSKTKREFVASFIKEAENLDIMKRYPYLLDWLRDSLINPKNGNLWIAIQQSEDFFEEIENTISSFINEEEVIYCNKAMEYLRDYDTCLDYALEEAQELGYETKDLNAELLATLSLQSKLREAIIPLIDELKEEASY